MRLTNASGTAFDLEVEREVRLLFDRARPGTRPACAVCSGGVAVVGFETRNRVTNRGAVPWRRETGLVSIWIAGTFAPSPSTTIVLPFRAGSRTPSSARSVNDRYFGRVPSDRLAGRGERVYFRGDGQQRGKIGVSPRRARPVLGSYDARRRRRAHAGDLHAPRGRRRARLRQLALGAAAPTRTRGDAINAYNDGPATPGAAPFGPFYELETSSPALALAPGESAEHIHRTLHFVGAPGGSRRMARASLGVGIAEITAALVGPSIGAGDVPPSFVDAHVHFWDGARMPYPWLAERAGNRGRAHARRARARGGRALPEAIVFVESAVDPARALDEVAWVEALAAREPRIAAIVAQVAVDRGAETEAALAALAGHALRARRAPQPAGLSRPGALSAAGVHRRRARGRRAGVDVRSLRPARAAPRLHRARARLSGDDVRPRSRGQAGHPRRRPRSLAAELAALARLPNVVCKLSGLVTEADPATWTPAALRPYVEHLLSCFGPGRLLFGSDWPVVNLAANYRRWLETALELLAPLSAGERAAVLSDNARRIYRLS